METGIQTKINDRLQKRGNIYVDCCFDPELIGPACIKMINQDYYRFMDYFYSPKRPHEMVPKEVVEICDLRLDYLDKVINYKFNEEVVSYMTEYVKQYHKKKHAQNLQILDFGCGSGLSSQLIGQFLDNISIIGVDISRKAVGMAKEAGIDSIHVRLGDTFPFSNDSFDIVFAVFVAHFSIESFSIGELFRTLKKQGILIYNCYNIEASLVMNTLSKYGFSDHQILSTDALPKNHFISVCSK